MFYPPDFVKSLKEAAGNDRGEEILASLDTPASVSIRLNTSKTKSVSELFPHNMLKGKVPHCNTGFFLKERPLFTDDPLFQAGAYYVQDASSMIVEKVCSFIPDDAENLTILDLCAAPGGKSTHLISIACGYRGSLVISNEVIKSRATILAENISKWGYPDVVVTNNDAADFRKFPIAFDIILADVPCSGEGMFRKDKNAILEWSADNVNLCAQRQRRIVADIWSSLKDGGLLLYSTCTFNRKENEENIEWISSSLGGDILYVKRFFPCDEDAGEGLFFSIIRKKTKCEVNGYHTDFSRKIKQEKFQPDWCSDNTVFIRKGDLLKGYTSCALERILAAEQTLHTVISSVAVADIIDSKSGKKGPLLVPRTELIQSSLYKKGSLPEIELPLETFGKFFRKENFTIADAPTGYVVLTYHGIPVGVVKNIGNRVNNLWPSSRRILK